MAALAVPAGCYDLHLRPITLQEGRRFVAEHHRHNGPPLSWRFGVGLELSGELVGVAMAGRPMSKELDDGRTIEVMRTCTLGHRNASSRLYGAICRAAAALGYARVITYTLASEDGSSLRASGFARVAAVRDRTWTTPRRPRHEATLWGERVVPAGRKVRWQRDV